MGVPLSGDNPSLSSHDEYIGSGGSGGFTQNSGTNTVTGGWFRIAEMSGSTGVYNLNGGTLSALNQYVGVSGNGTLNQAGGTNSVAFLAVGAFRRFHRNV